MGTFELLVFDIVMKLGSPYSVEIYEELAKSGREVSLGALYTTLNRLERKGYLSSELGDPTPARGGRAKRHYRAEGVGVRAARSTHRKMMWTWADRIPAFAR